MAFSHVIYQQFLNTIAGVYMRDMGSKSIHGRRRTRSLTDSRKARGDVDKERRDTTKKSLWRWMKRRSAVEPRIGHLKQEHRMDRNRLSGELGDDVNALLSTAGMNFRKLIRRLADFFAFILGRHISGFWLVQPVRAFA